MTVKTHKTTRHFTETVITPEHIDREESEDFRHSKDRLKQDGHYRCWVCNSTEDLQVHHLGCEWSLQNVCDFEKLKAFCEEWDVYGYGRLLKNIPIENADDVRNMLVLCRGHHLSGDKDGAANGIHNITFPVWVMQKLAIQDESPVPQDGEDPGHVLKEFEELSDDEDK